MLAHPRRIPFLALAIGFLLLGMGTGLVRLGFDVPLGIDGLLASHAPLMVCAFLGTLITFERAVALGGKFTLLAPTLLLAGGVVAVWDPSSTWAPLLFLVGSLGLVAIMGYLFLRERTVHGAVMVVGAECWVVGNIVAWVAPSAYMALPWWVAFLLLTVLGERLELTRILPISGGRRRVLIGLLAILIVAVIVVTYGFLGDEDSWLEDGPYGMVWDSVWTDLPSRVFGLALVLLAVWFLQHDVARRNLSRVGVSRFAAVCMLTSYGWLILCGSAHFAFGTVISGFAFDIAVHTFFLGFIMGMIFGHAPLIFPGILGIDIRFSKAFYVPWFLLHASLLMRIVADLAASDGGRKLWGAMNVVSILLFFVVVVTSVRPARV